MRSEDRVARPGSSPLTRGKRGGGDPGVASGRLIPAHAGKTLCRGWHCHGRGAHPRSRGENGEAEIPEWRLDGSSPLTRGKRVERGANLIHIRLIPAHAGKTPSTCPADRRSRAHPRSRGENDEDASGGVGEAGSSPLTRGKRRRLAQRIGDRGLIPAHAGKTMRTRPAGLGRRAHPRSRGENRLDVLRHDQFAGSSPLTRGKRAPRTGGSCRGRLIPAHAGKTR